VSLLVLVLAWAAIGAVAGIGVRWGSVKLALLEELEPGHRRWQTYGPPILCAVLFAAFAYRFAGSLPWLSLESVFVLVLVQVIFFDLEHRLILDRVIFPSMVLALVVSLFNQPWWAGAAAGLGAGLLFVLIGVVASAVLKADALGFGDAKLAAFIGLLVGPLPTLEALTVGIVLAGLFATSYAIWHRSMQGSIALGPFLAIGALLALLRLG
jgi:prepilin signal peptidase PulO-like enzyme (type II secretory pathway)